MAKESDLATPSMREFIFWRDVMTPEEFEKEREYFYLPQHNFTEMVL